MAGDGELVKEWKRLLGWRSTFWSASLGVEYGGGAVLEFDCAVATAGAAFCLVDEWMERCDGCFAAAAVKARLVGIVLDGAVDMAWRRHLLHIDRDIVDSYCTVLYSPSRISSSLMLPRARQTFLFRPDSRERASTTTF